MNVELVHWNPSRPRFPGKFGRLLKVPTNNFGDLLGPMIVRRILERQGIEVQQGERSVRLLSVGSVLRLAREGDVVWGSGANGKSLDAQHDYSRLDIRAVRGPLTKAFLEAKGITVPSVFGDPGLLVSHLWTREEIGATARPEGTTVVPNLHDYEAMGDRSKVVNPRGNVWDIVRRIACSKLVVGSSLHGIVIAEAFGVPARLVASRTEPAFKYEDYYRGTGRSEFEMAADVHSAEKMGGEPALDWNPSALLNAFPSDLWAAGRDASISVEG